MDETFNAKSFQLELLAEQRQLPASYKTDYIVADTPSVLRETTVHTRVTPKELETTFVTLVESGKIPRGRQDECFRVTVANGHEFQTIIYDPSTGDPIGCVIVSSTREELDFVLKMSGIIPQPIPPTYASQIILVGQTRNDAVATSALQFTYEYAAVHTANGKILLKEWAISSGQDDYSEEQIFLRIIDDKGTLYHQPASNTYQGMISRAPELSGKESYSVSDFLCLPQQTSAELMLAGYTLSDELLTRGDIPIATLTPDQSWHFTPEASYADICFINQLSRLAILEPTAVIDTNRDLVLLNEYGTEVFRSSGRASAEIQLETTEKTSVVVWASPTLTEEESEMFTTITSTGKIITPYVHRYNENIYDPLYLSRATIVIDPNKPGVEYIASAFLVLNEGGKLVAYDPINVPLNQWLTTLNKTRKTAPYPILSGVHIDKYGQATPIEVVEPPGAYSLQEAKDKVQFTMQMRAILPDFVVLPECKAINKVTLQNGDVVYQLLYQRPRSISLDSIAAAALSSRAIHRLHNTRIMQTAIALKAMIDHNTIHLSLHTGNRQISLVDGRMRLYIGDWDEMIQLSDWSNKGDNKRVSGFDGNSLSFHSARNMRMEDALRNYSNNITLTPRQIVIMYGLQRFLFTEMLGSLRMISSENVPAEKAFDAVLNNTIDMLILAFAQSSEQRAHYGKYREILIEEVEKLSPNGTMAPEANGGSPWDFLPMAIAIVITKWYYPADGERMFPGDPIGVSPARQTTQLPPPTLPRAATQSMKNEFALKSVQRRR